MDQELIFDEFVKNFPNLEDEVVYSTSTGNDSIQILLKDSRKFKFKVTDEGFSLVLV